MSAIKHKLTVFIIFYNSNYNLQIQIGNFITKNLLLLKWMKNVSNNLVFRFSSHTIINNQPQIFIQRFIDLLYLLQLEAMSENTRKQYAQIIHSEVMKSFERLAGYMDELTCPALVEHCRIWKVDKGARKLIQLAIEGDKFMTKEYKNFKKSNILNSKASDQELQPNSSMLKKHSNKKALIKQMEEPSNTENAELIKKEQILDEIDDCGLYLSQHCKKEQTSKIKIEDNIQQSFVKKQSQSYILDNLILENDIVEAILKRKNDKKRRRYMRGPYRNYTRELKQKMVELYKCNELSLSQLSLQFDVPIKNIKRWAENGIERKEGAGRKRLDPQMQQQLCAQISERFEEGKQLSIQQIRLLALRLSKVADFKASKGWVISFIERHKLDEVYQII